MACCATRPASPARRRCRKEAVAALVERTLGEPPGETTHWTSRAMAAVTGLAISTVQKIWRAHGLQPHRLRTFKLSRDPEFAAKVRDVVGLYVDPPAHAVVLSVDEKSQIQALDRTQPGLPMKKGRAGTHDPRLHPERHHDPVRRAQRARRHGRRPVHAAAPAPGVPALPQPSRARRSRPASWSTSSSTTTAATSTPRSAPGSRAIPAGPSTSPRPRPPGSTRSRASSPS